MASVLRPVVGTYSGGFVGLAGLCAEVKHGIAAIASPFSDCMGIWDVVRTLFQLQDTVFLGVLLWTAMLVTSLSLASRALVKAGAGLLRWFRAANRGPAAP
jgi:hypothetical protein